jgi:hypothetical protein
MIRVPLCLIIALLGGVLQGVPAKAGTDADQFLVVERPAGLMLLNRYQQNLSPQELALLQPFTPFRILRTRDLLGDGFTPCMRVEMAGVEYFMVRETDGRLAGESRAGKQRLYQGVALPHDTVRVLGGGLRFLGADGGGGRFLRAGEMLVRVFSSSGMTCVKQVGHQPVYGWVTLTAAGAQREWSLQRRVPVAETAIPAQVRDSIRAAIVRTNTLMANLFAYFRSRTGRARETPRWQVEESPAALRCTLLGGSPDRDFPESTRYLVRDLETFVLGTNLGVFRSSGSIEIRSR